MKLKLHSQYINNSISFVPNPSINPKAYESVKKMIGQYAYMYIPQNVEKNYEAKNLKHLEKVRINKIEWKEELYSHVITIQKSDGSIVTLEERKVLKGDEVNDICSPFWFNFTDEVNGDLNVFELVNPFEEYNYSNKVWDAIRNHQFFIGMTAEMVIDSLGAPNDRNISVGSWGKHEQWVYPNNLYLYIENGVLTSYQK